MGGLEAVWLAGCLHSRQVMLKHIEQLGICVGFHIQCHQNIELYLFFEVKYNNFFALLKFILNFEHCEEFNLKHKILY